MSAGNGAATATPTVAALPARGEVTLEELLDCVLEARGEIAELRAELFELRDNAQKLRVAAEATFDQVKSGGLMGMVAGLLGR